MSDFIIGLSQVMRAEVDALNSIAQNSANINTAGYKSIRSTAGDMDFSQSITTNRSSETIKTKVNTSRGQVNITERSLDFAIVGDGWFGVQHNNEVRLTRNGSFKLNAENVLVTRDGDPVLGVNGLITLPSEAVTMGPNGTLVAPTGEQVQLGIYDASINSISSVGNGLYSASNINLVDGNTKILQGAVEESNVDSASDMVRLMETTRHIESMQRAINTYNEMLNTGINQIGK